MMSTKPDKTGPDGSSASNELTQKLTDFSGLNNALRDDLKKVGKLANSDSSDTAAKVSDFQKEHSAIVTDLEKLTHSKPESAIAAASGPAAPPSTQSVSVSSKRSISVATQTDCGGKSESQSASSSAAANSPSSVAPSSGRLVSAAGSSSGFFGTAAASLSSIQEEQYSSARATNIGDEENVLVSWIVSPSLFWLQNEREMEGAKTKWTLAELLHQFFGIGQWKPLEVVTTGVRVMAPFNEPSDYYRAIILRDAGKVTLNTRTRKPKDVAFVLVWYVDYGNAEFVAKESLYVTPAQLDRMPYLARPARLLGFKPIEENTWSLEECERFETLFNTFATPEDKKDGVIRAVATLEIEAADAEKEEAYAMPELLDWPKGRQTVSMQLRRSDGHLEPLRKLLLDDVFCLFASNLGTFGVYPSNSPKDVVVMVLPTRFYDWQVAGIAKLDLQQPHGSASSDRNVVSVERAGDSNGAVNAIPIVNQPSGSANQDGSNRRGRSCIVPPHQVQLLPGSTIQFYVSMVSSPSEFYIQPLLSKKGEGTICKSYYTEMHDMMDLCYNIAAYRKPVDFNQLSQNPFCAVKFEGHWKRGQAVSAPAHGTHCEVRLFDTGRKVVCSILDIWELTPTFTELPIQAVQCSLSDVAPVDAAGWSNRATERFKGFMNVDASKALLMQAFVVENVPLKLRVTLSGSAVLINDLMIQQGLARSA